MAERITPDEASMRDVPVLPVPERTSLVDLRMPFAAAAVASVAFRPISLAPVIAPCMAPLAALPRSPATADVSLITLLVAAIIASAASTLVSLVLRNVPTTAFFAADPTSPPISDTPRIAARPTSETASINDVPTVPVPLLVCARVPLTVSTTAFATSPVPLIVPTTPFFTTSNMPLFSSIGLSFLSFESNKDGKPLQARKLDKAQAEEHVLRMAQSQV